MPAECVGVTLGHAFAVAVLGLTLLSAWIYGGISLDKDHWYTPIYWIAPPLAVAAYCW